MSDTFEDVQAAQLIRREQIRAWAQKNIDNDAAVTFLPDGPIEEPVAQQLDPTPTPESEVEPGPAVEPADRSDIETEEGDETEVAEVESVEPQAETPETDTIVIDEPSHSDNKGEWVAYRIKTHDLTEDQANEYTKKELIELA